MTEVVVDSKEKISSGRMDVVIIGAGTAALATAAEVKRATKIFIIVSNGIYGTTCVRAGCMPSKILIEAAHVFDGRGYMERMGRRPGVYRAWAGCGLYYGWGGRHEFQYYRRFE